MAWRSGRGGRVERRRARILARAAAPAAENRRAGLAAKAGDFEAARHAVEDAAGFVRGLWVTFVSLQAYLVVVTVSVTHRQLFLEAPIKLPLVDVELPLVGFFVLAPLLFLAFHSYLLIQVRLLAAKVARLNEVLAAARPAEAVETGLRLQLPNDIVVQYLAGARIAGERTVAAALGFVAWATLVAAPVAALLTMQLKFLPYQDEAVTWVHRGAALADVALLWALWPGVLKRRWRRPDRARLRRAASLARNTLASVLAIAAATQALTFPGEAMDDLPPAQAFHCAMVWPLPEADSADGTKAEDAKCGAAPAQALGLADRFGLGAWLHAHLAWPADDSEFVRFLRDTPQANRVITGTLRLANAVLVDEEKAERVAAREEKAGRKPWEGERTLRFENPRRFFAANLAYADLSRSDLRRSVFDHAFAPGVILTAAWLDGAHFNAATLDHAQMEKLSADGAQLRGGSLDGVQLQDASLLNAQLQGASLNEAQLQGTLLNHAKMVDASLNKAQLQGASLDFAELPGADLVDAQLQGASLHSAFLQGASLKGARCEGASFNHTQLQGAILFGAEFEGAEMTEAVVARVWGTPQLYATLGDVDFQLVYMVDPIFPNIIENISSDLVDFWIHYTVSYLKARPIKPNHDYFIKNLTTFRSNFRLDRISKALDKLLYRMEENEIFSEKETQFRINEIRARFIRLKPNGLTAGQDLEERKFWLYYNQNPHPAAFGAFVADWACRRTSGDAHDENLSPYVARGMLRNGVLDLTGEAEPGILAKMRAGRDRLAACPGVEGFTAEDWALVDRRIDETKPAALRNEPSRK